jgi:hypothetical protein
MKPNHHWLFPDGLSDESAAAFSRFLRNLANECERRYASQIRRHNAGQMNLYDPEQPWLCKQRGKNRGPS